MGKYYRSRRKFIKAGASAVVSSAVALPACGLSPEEKSVNINFNKKHRWKMTTTWPPNFPIMGEGCGQMARWIEKMSGGRLEIVVYGGGELIPALEGFDAVSNGAVEMNHGAAYYWAGKLPSAPFFTAVPFGMNAWQMGSWMMAGRGMNLWKELYAPYGLLPFMCGNTGIQMGGWFNKEVSSISDLKGLKMRIPGLGGKVLAKAGGTPLLVSGGEIYTNMERGVIDATEWIGPYHDYKMGFHQVAKNYYYPGWHETGPLLELIVNKTKYLKLPEDLREIIAAAAHRLNRWMSAEFDAKNGAYLQKIKESTNVNILPFSNEVLGGLKAASREVIRELTGQDPFAKKVHGHYEAFRKQVGGWTEIGEKEYYRTLA